MAMMMMMMIMMLCIVCCMEMEKSEGLRIKGYEGDSNDLFPNGTGISRSDFPPGFVFGTLTMALKHEGAVEVDGKSLNIWDVYASFDGITEDGAIPATSGNSYYRYKDDIGYMTDMGVDAYRFSIAWARLFPNNSNEVNTLAIDHYNKVIDAVIEAGLEPHVTLWVQDHPQWMLDDYGGPLNKTFIDDFLKFADTCFKEFGDRVKYWITFDEPNDYVALAYASSQNPPGRCSIGIVGHGICFAGDSAIEPYIVTHIILLAHGYATKLYRERYQENQNGQIGLAVWFIWNEPFDNSSAADIEASQRATDFAVGWYLDPLMFGDYPSSMRQILGDRLPTFTKEESDLVRGSLDFIGLNMVTAFYVENSTNTEVNGITGYWEDKMIKQTQSKEGVNIGWGEHDFAVPWAMEKIIDYIKIKYGNPPTWITETGWGLDDTSLNITLEDDERIHFYQTFLSSVKTSLGNGADVRGFFAWSLLDGFEFQVGLSNRFGFYYLDENLERHPRKSALWYKTMLHENEDGKDSSSYHRSLRGRF